MATTTASKPAQKANRLAEYREKRHLTQKQVGKLLDMTEAAVSRHESGDRSLTDAMIVKYAELYDVPSHKLFV